MKAFSFASPRREAEVLQLLSSRPDTTEVLAGGTDLVGRLKSMVAEPDLVVNIMEVDSLGGISADSTGVVIGAITTLDDLLESSELEPYPAVKHAIAGINSAQLQAQGTIGGELCQRPRCWYYRGGHGLTADDGRLVARGENRYHAILGNSGPAKFVSASRVAPALIALGARVRIAGPGPDDESVLPLESFFRTPRTRRQRETVLQPNQLLTHVLLPPDGGLASATYEVRQSAGPDYPLASASAALHIEGGVVRDASIVMGHVAPIPWVSHEAAQAIIGHTFDHQSAAAAGDAAVRRATPLSDNLYKVQLARVAVQRAILMAAGLETGGF